MYLTTTIPSQYPQGQVSLNVLVYVSVGIAAVFLLMIILVLVTLSWTLPQEKQLLQSVVSSLFFYDQIKKFMTFCNNQMVLCYS